MNFTIDISDLSPCEQQYAEQLVTGLTKKEIADVFYRSPRTIESTVRNMYEKTGCRNSTEFASWYWSRLVRATIDTSQPIRKIILTLFFLALTVTTEVFSSPCTVRTRTVKTSSVRTRKNELDNYIDDLTTYLYEL